MAVNISHPLLPLHFSRNAIDVEFVCPDKFVTPGSLYRIVGIFSAYPTDNGDLLEFSYEKDGVTIEKTLTFNAAPDPDELEIETYSSGALAWLTDHLLPGLQADPDIANDFELSVIDDDPIFSISLRARFYSDTPGTFTGTGCTIVNSIPIAGSIPEAQPNYRLSAWLYIGQSSEPSSNFLRTPEIELDTDIGGFAQLDLQAYADSFMYAVETPTLLTDQPVLCSHINRPAYLLFGQKWGDTLVRKRNHRSPDFRILKGGMEDREFAAVKNGLPSAFLSRFLTIRTERSMCSGQKDWLYFLVTEELENVELIVRPFTYFAGLQPEISVWPESPTLLKGRTYQFRIDPAIYAFAADTVYYQVYLKYQVVDEILSPEGTTKIRVNLKDHYLDQVFEFENTFGAIESICFRGEQNLAAAATKELYSTHSPFNAGAEHTTLHSHNERITKQITCSTGPMSKIENLAFADFIRSRHQWYIPATGPRIPVRIPKAEALLQSINRQADYARDSEFTVEISSGKGVSANIY